MNTHQHKQTTNKHTCLCSSCCFFCSSENFLSHNALSLASWTFRAWMSFSALDSLLSMALLGSWPPGTSVFSHPENNSLRWLLWYEHRTRRCTDFWEVLREFFSKKKFHSVFRVISLPICDSNRYMIECGHLWWIVLLTFEGSLCRAFDCIVRAHLQHRSIFCLSIVQLSCLIAPQVLS